MVETSEADLVEAAQAGDRAALDQLVEQHAAEIYRFGKLMCRDPEDAKDVLQETLLAMAKSLASFRGSATLSTWLSTIARRFCSKKRRGQPQLDSHEGVLDGLADDAPRPDDAVADKELEHALSRSISALEPKYREVLLLRDMEGLPAKEVASVLGISVEAVKNRLHRGRLGVRQAMAPFLGMEETPEPAPGCPDVLALLSRHLEGEISPETCKTMELHLEGCGRCRGACDSLRASLALCRRSRAEAVPPELGRAVREAVFRAISELE